VVPTLRTNSLLIKKMISLFINFPAQQTITPLNGLIL
jgi:hypothetical protein